MLSHALGEPLRLQVLGVFLLPEASALWATVYASLKLAYIWFATRGKFGEAPRHVHEDSGVNFRIQKGCSVVIFMYQPAHEGCKCDKNAEGVK